MIDLTNKTPEELNEIIKKYSSVLEILKTQPNALPYIAYIINFGVEHINTNHKNLTTNLKTWCIFVLKEQYQKNKINSDNDIIKYVNDFITYHQQNYEDYNNSRTAVSDYDMERGFVYGYLNKKG